MSTNQSNFSPDSGLDKGISMLSKEEWINLCTFFNSAIYDNPTSEPKMRLKLGISKTDEFKKEFKETVEIFQKLETYGHKFEDNVREEVLSLADDIVQYQAIADTVLERLKSLVDRFDWDGPDGLQEKLDALVKIWGGGQPTGRSEKIKQRFKQAVERLATEATSRAQRADSLYQTLIGADGLKANISVCKTKFDLKTLEFNQKFGEESEEIIELKASIEAIQAELKALRKKEKDEVIVLSTSPLYLAIPIFGPLVLAGVDIGVGVDLANVRAKIKAKVKECKAFSKTLSVTESFKSQYNLGKNMTDEISKDIETVLPQLELLGNGWRAISKDLSSIVSVLSEDGLGTNIPKEDWGNLIVSIETARTTWKGVAAKADHFRTVAVPIRTEDAGRLPAAAA